MSKESNPEKLNSPIFEAFSRSVDKQYIYICDVKTNIWRWSSYAVEYFGLPGEYVQNFSDFWMERVHPDDRICLGAEFDKLFSGAAAEHSCEYRVMNALDEYVWIRCKGCMVKDKDGGLDLCAGILTELGSRNKFDPITGILSFFEFQSVMESILTDSEKKGGALLWGIDQFRRINDGQHYVFGNELLNAYAKQLPLIMPPEAILFRMTGDQFAVIYPDAVFEKLTALFERILSVGTKGIKIGNKKQRFTVSCGAVLYPEHGREMEQLYTSAEYALETAKRHNREGITFFTGQQQEESLRLFQMRQKLRESVENGCEGFSVYYQPLISCGDRELRGAEALLRWTNPEFPSVSPVDFIPLLEESGDINTVGKWVLTSALEQMSEWLKKKPNLKISVNVSYLQLKDASFKEFVMSETEKYQFPRTQLMLELTESCNVLNPIELAKELNYFRKHGIQIALDDFGTGYASLSVLRDLSADWIKIDHSFVAQIADSGYDQALTEHLIQLCEKLGMKVCVEGIETVAIQDVIEQYHPSILQGYLYSRPVTKVEFEKNFIL